jgi:tRNA (guanine-N7-)-methyltransferase
MLHLNHPEYRYPPSRNPYASRLALEYGDREAYVDDRTESRRGGWREAFPPEARRELHVEIGCNGGHVLLEWAARRPEAAWVGVDWKFKQIHRGAEKARKRGLKNVRFFRAHAERLPFMFGPGEIDHLYLFFPDPWAKLSQQKNRFLTAARLRELAGIVRPGGAFHIRTDHPGYFEWMEAAVAAIPELWEVEYRTADLHAGNPDAGKLQCPDVTLFERIFIREGKPIHALRLRRRATSPL